MYVCICNGISDHDIRRAAKNGVKSVKELKSQLGVASQCAKCACHAKEILREFPNPNEQKISKGSPPVL